MHPTDEAGKARFSNVVHWAYGTSWGAFRGMAGATGISPVPATALHFAAIWGGAQVILPALDVAPPAWEWDPVEIAIDVLHHTVYVVATELCVRNAGTRVVVTDLSHEPHGRQPSWGPPRAARARGDDRTDLQAREAEQEDEADRREHLDRGVE